VQDAFALEALEKMGEILAKGASEMREEERQNRKLYL